MKWIEACVVFDFADRELAADLIADIFYDLGIKGVVVESTVPDTEADWADGVAKTPEKDAVRGYFPKIDASLTKIESLKKRIASLTENLEINARLICSELDEEDWAESWKAHFHPVKIGGRIVVKPTWEAYAPQPDERIIEIDPGMAFGTGTHATTALCIRLLEKYAKPEMTVLDVGTGSGILLIAAAKFGVQKALGVDSDPVAVTVAKENLQRNGLSAPAYEVRSGDLAGDVSGIFDLVVANILSEVILDLLDHVDKVISPEGIFICSGIISEKAEMVADKMRKSGFTIIEKAESEGWTALAGKKRL